MGFLCPPLFLPIVSTSWKELYHIFQMQFVGPDDEDVLFVIENAQFVCVPLRLCQILANESQRGVVQTLP